MRASRLGASRLGPSALVAALVAATVFWIAYDNGSYGLQSRGTLAIAIWWALMVTIVFGLLPHEQFTRASIAHGGMIAALAAWTLASLLWSTSAEKTFDEFNRVTLYLGVFLLVTVASTRRNVGRWADGLAIAVAAVAAVALASRLFPDVFPEGDIPTFLPGAVTRLSFPLGYWNGLAIFVALGIPLLLRVAVVARSAAVRGLALAPMPVIAGVIYLASSRGGALAAFVGSAVFLLLAERRWSVAAALGTALLGAAATIAVLLDRDELVDGPLGTQLVEEQGRSAAGLILLVSAGLAVAYALGCRALGGRIRPGRLAGRIAVLAAAAIVVAAVLLADPVERFETFRTPPGELRGYEPGDFVKQHLLSGSGSGRWQIWAAAVDEWREYPLLGEGAGAYEAWWAENGTISLFVRDAHSLYLEALGELGPVGFVLVVAIVLVGVGTGVRRARSADGETRVTAAALTALLVSYGVAAAFDWVWELAAVSTVAFVALALVSSAGLTVPAAPRAVADAAPRARLRGRFGLGVAVLLAAWCLVLAQAIPLLAQGEIADSQDKARRGDLQAALDDASAARDIQPWAASPYLQLALLAEQTGNLRVAREWIGDAIERDDRDWRLWLVSARIETKLGRTDAAERSLRRAAALNPRSPLFAGLLPETVQN